MIRGFMSPPKDADLTVPVDLVISVDHVGIVPHFGHMLPTPMFFTITGTVHNRFHRMKSCLILEVFKGTARGSWFVGINMEGAHADAFNHFLRDMTVQVTGTYRMMERSSDDLSDLIIFQPLTIESIGLHEDTKRFELGQSLASTDPSFADTVLLPQTPASRIPIAALVPPIVGKSRVQRVGPPDASSRAATPSPESACVPESLFSPVKNPFGNVASTSAASQGGTSGPIHPASPRKLLRRSLRTGTFKYLIPTKGPRMRPSSRKPTRAMPAKGKENSFSA
ncbi:hypothetical protein FRB99_005131 [Tulasnella sp. 403]|nr:hypothetical protein FRB99_005131 [Tulasnella sp. 403]